MQERLNRSWTDRAPAYDDYQQRPERRAADHDVWSQIWRAHLPPPPAHVLDVGTGSGTMARLLATLGCDVTAIDLSAGMLARARAHDMPRSRHTGSLCLLEGDAVTPAFPDQHFDAITNRYLMWTLREPERALDNWLTLLRPGGRLAVVDSTWFPDGLDADEDSEFHRTYDDIIESLPLATSAAIDDTARLVESAGFHDVRVTPLEEVWELDRHFGVAPGHELRMQFLISARRGED